MRPLQFAVLFTIASIWGASFMLIKVMVEEISPVAVGWIRLGGGGVLIAVVLLAMLAAGRVEAPRSGRYWLDVVVVAALATAIPFTLIPWGTEQIPSNLAAVLNGAMPFWAVILSTAFLPAERLTAQKAVGVVLGFGGLALIIGPDALDIRAGSTQGQFAVVLAALSYAAGAVYIRRRLLGTSPWLLAGAQNWAAFAMLTPFVILGGHAPDFPALEGRTLAAAAALAVVAQGVAIPLYFWLVSNVEAAQAAFVTYLAPVTAQFWGWFVLSETPGTVLIPGMGLVIAGMVFLNRRPRVAGAPAPVVADGAGQVDP